MNRVLSLRYSLGAKINLVFIMMLVLFIVFSFFNRTSMSQFSDNYSQQINMYESVLQLKQNIDACNISINEYIRTGNRTNLADFNEISTQIRSTIKNLENEVTQEDVVYLLRSIRNSFSTYYTECSNASFNFVTQSYDYLSRIYYANMINDYLLKYCDELLTMTLGESVRQNGLFLESYDVLSAVNDVVIIFVSIFSSIFVIYVIKFITIPLNLLMSKVKEISRGNFDVQLVLSNRPGTIELLSKTFNDMAFNIKGMMEDLKEKVFIESKLLEEQKKNIESREILNQAVMLALQTQTNPHFLFNTLNSISRTVTLGRNDMAIDMIDALSNLLRYSLSDPEVPVTLEEEIYMTRYYLDIQHYRFSERLNIQTIYDDNVNYQVQLPKFSLQPLIENAITHGISSLENNAKLVISVKQIKSSIYIRIFDNGIGMSKTLINEVLERDIHIRTHHIGLSNTYKRLLLFTKEEQVLKIRSRKNKGTLVTICLKGVKHV